MKGIRIVMLVAIALAVAALPAFAATSKPTGKDNAVAKVEAATAKHTQILTDLLARAPEQARDGIQKAIDASIKGHDEALAALNGHPGDGQEAAEADTGKGSETDTDADTETDTDTDQGKGGKPDTTGLVNARARVAAAFQKSETHLQSVIATVPTKAAAKIQDALTRITAQRALVLQTLDGLIAGQKFDRGAAERALHASERPEHPAHPDRPDRPDAPERPDHPQPPDHPDRPDHPAHGF